MLENANYFLVCSIHATHYTVKDGFDTVSQRLFRVYIADTAGMYFIALGLLLGSAAVASPGPLSLGLIQVAVSQGRGSGRWAGFGISSGDIAMLGGAIAVISAGASMPASVFMAIQIISISYLGFVGLTLVAKPAACAELAANIRRPGKTFFWATTLNPSVFGSWLAVLLAMPFSDDLSKLALFGVGAGFASLAWFQVLGSGAGAFSNRMSPRVVAWLSRAGGIGTLALGAWALSAAL